MDAQVEPNKLKSEVFAEYFYDRLVQLFPLGEIQGGLPKSHSELMHSEEFGSIDIVTAETAASLVIRKGEGDQETSIVIVTPRTSGYKQYGFEVTGPKVNMDKLLAEIEEYAAES